MLQLQKIWSDILLNFSLALYLRGWLWESGSFSIIFRKLKCWSWIDCRIFNWLCIELKYTCASVVSNSCYSRKKFKAISYLIFSLALHLRGWLWESGCFSRNLWELKCWSWIDCRIINWLCNELKYTCASVVSNSWYNCEKFEAITY